MSCGRTWRRRRSTQKHGLDAVVPSGLYGLTTAQEEIADYRLKLTAHVAPLGSLAVFWRQVVTDVVSTLARGATIVNFLPKEHESALDFAALPRQVNVVKVRFVTSDGARAAGHDAKAVKGVSIRRVLEHGPEALDGFAWMGWRAAAAPEGIVVTAPTERLLGMQRS